MNMYENAKEMYASIGVDTESAIEKLGRIPISIHCWQGDDVSGFENSGLLTGGIQTTGNYPGKARNPEELKADIKQMLTYVGGSARLSLHANYAETHGKKADRNELLTEHFSGWVDFAKEEKIGLDFNTTMFSHPKSAGFTLSHIDKGIRDFWVEHAICARKIAQYFGESLNQTTVTNHWIPDGMKDIPANRMIYRNNLKESLDRIFSFETPNNKDSVESKVFGIGTESYTVGSHEFYMGYAVKNNLFLTLDTGHFHPTEYVSDKLSGIYNFVDGILLHVSRPVRWDSDHVVILDDELIRIMAELCRHNMFEKVKIGLDFFDASINRIAAWVIGVHSAQKALLMGLLEPSETLFKLEAEGDYTSRLALMEEYKAMPWCAVWDEFCRRENIYPGSKWLPSVKEYEKNILLKR